MENLFASDLTVKLFLELEKSDIYYAVLRNSQGLPISNNSKDVDVLVSPKDLNDVKTLLLRLGEEMGYKCIWKNPLDYLYGCVFVKVVKTHIYSVKFDLFNGLKWRGFEYCNVDDLLRSRSKENVFILNKMDEAIVMLMYYSLYAGHIRTKYRSSISHQIDDNDFNARFESLTGLRINIDLPKSTIDWEFLTRKISQKARFKFVYNINAYPLFFKSCYTEIVVRNRFGAFIGISGFDGCGKSTLIEPVNELLHGLGIVDRVQPDHLLSHRIPAPHALFKRTKTKGKTLYTTPYSKNESGYLSSIIRLFYYLLSFTIDRVFIRMRMRNNRIVIFDRYILDFIVDLSRFRIKRVPLIPEILKYVQSKRDINIMVLVDPKLSVQRKGELTLEKATDLHASYLRIAEQRNDISLHDNSHCADESMESFCLKIFQNLEIHYAAS